MLSFGTVKWRSAMPSVATNNRLLACSMIGAMVFVVADAPADIVVCNVIGMGICVEVWASSPDNSLSSFEWIASIPVLSSNVSVGFINISAADCVFGMSLASEKWKWTREEEKIDF